MDGMGSAQKLMEGKLVGGDRGKVYMLWWINDVEKDRVNMDVKMRRIIPWDRIECTPIVKEAKAKYKGPEC
jgi:hypothetical protein